MDFCVRRNTILEQKRSPTENNQSFPKILFEVSHGEWYYLIPNSFSVVWEKRIVKATKLEESHLFSYTYEDIII